MATSATTVRDEHYDMVSVLYHTLQEAETLQQYIDDANAAGDDGAVRFFREVQEEDRARAQRAKELLRDRLSR